MGQPRKTERDDKAPKSRDDTAESPQRTGPGSGAGRGNDLPSEADTQRDSRGAEGRPETPERPASVDREVATGGPGSATGPGSGSQNIDAAK